MSITFQNTKFQNNPDEQIYALDKYFLIYVYSSQSVQIWDNFQQIFSFQSAFKPVSVQLFMDEVTFVSYISQSGEAFLINLSTKQIKSVNLPQDLLMAVCLLCNKQFMYVFANTKLQVHNLSTTGIQTLIGTLSSAPLLYKQVNNQLYVVSKNQTCYKISNTIQQISTELKIIGAFAHNTQFVFLASDGCLYSDFPVPTEAKASNNLFRQKNSVQLILKQVLQLQLTPESDKNICFQHNNYIFVKPAESQNVAIFSSITGELLSQINLPEKSRQMQVNGNLYFKTEEGLKLVQFGIVEEAVQNMRVLLSGSFKENQYSYQYKFLQFSKYLEECDKFQLTSNPSGTKNFVYKIMNFENLQQFNQLEECVISSIIIANPIENNKTQNINQSFKSNIDTLISQLFSFIKITMNKEKTLTTISLKLLFSLLIQIGVTLVPSLNTFKFDILKLTQIQPALLKNLEVNTIKLCLQKAMDLWYENEYRQLDQEVILFAHHLVKELNIHKITPDTVKPSQNIDITENMVFNYVRVQAQRQTNQEQQLESQFDNILAKLDQKLKVKVQLFCEQALNISKGNIFKNIYKNSSIYTDFNGSESILATQIVPVQPLIFNSNNYENNFIYNFTSTVFQNPNDLEQELINILNIHNDLWNSFVLENKTAVREKIIEYIQEISQIYPFSQNEESNQESSLHTTTMEFQFSMIIDQEAEKCLDESLSEKSTSIKLNNQKLNQYVYQFIQEHAFITSEDRAKSKINCIDAIQLLFQLSIRSKFKDSFKYALNLFTGIDCSQEAFNIKLRLKQLILSYASSIQNQNTIFDVIINTALAIKNEPNGSILAFLLCIATMNIFSYYDFGQVVSGYTDDQKQQLFCIGKIVEAALCTNWVLE
ncbi:Conserved_hypothetical protein [Hexamita inflata]|uniref:Uncharacterized protein n=1 Tax=Hexamita inflata TaxID=28002 RepID=A0AA86Q2G1_9EUKA|nr:Conserved hypothetical protein [Hexamita inflata]